MYFESHAHYDDKRFHADRDELLSMLLPGAGVEYVVNVGADMRSSAESIELARKYGYVYASIGVHPHESKSVTDGDWAAIEEMCRAPKVVAVGEIGLDFHYDFSDRNTQRKRFREQLEIARAAALPVIIHSRSAQEETFEILKESGVRHGVIHCFDGGPEEALKYVELGFYIGFGGILTFPKAQTAVAAAVATPLERILIETDCPYLSPAPNRGARNDSRNLKYICRKLAEIKGVSHKTAAVVTKKNAEALFFHGHFG